MSRCFLPNGVYLVGKREIPLDLRTIHQQKISTWRLNICSINLLTMCISMILKSFRIWKEIFLDFERFSYLKVIFLGFWLVFVLERYFSWGLKGFRICSLQVIFQNFDRLSYLKVAFLGFWWVFVFERYFSWILKGFCIWKIFFYDFERFSYLKVILLRFW